MYVSAFSFVAPSRERKVERLASPAGVYFMARALIHWLEKENRQKRGKKKIGKADTPFS